MTIRKNLLALALVGGLTVASAFAQNFTIDGVNYKVTSAEDRTVEIIANSVSNSCYSGEGGIFAPTIISNNGVDYIITSIGAGAFNNCDLLLRIILPNSVTSIGGFAFSLSDNLISVTLHDNIKDIGNNAFENCTGLTEFTFPSAVTRIEVNPFRRL